MTMKSSGTTFFGSAPLFTASANRAPQASGNIIRVRPLSLPPAGASRAVFERDPHFPQALANLVRKSEVLRLARFGAQIKEQLHQTVNQLILSRLAGSQR